MTDGTRDGWLGFLLDGTHDWRHRVVEEFVFGSGAHVRVTSAFQIDLRYVMAKAGIDPGGHTRARVLLPLTTRQKRPLLNLDIVGPDAAHVVMVPRSESSGLQAGYLRQLISTSRVKHQLSAAFSEDLLRAICSFTPDRWNNYRDRRLRRPSIDQSLVAYLREGTDGRLAPGRDDVRRWLWATRDAGDRLARSLGQTRSLTSSADEVLLAIPEMRVLPESIAAVDLLVQRYRMAVIAAYACDRFFLGVLAEYGRRYEVIVRAEVPIRDPFTVKLSEDRPLGRTGTWSSRQRFAINDAGRAHLEARFVDTSVRFSRHRVIGPDGQAIGSLESQRETPETLALYTSVPQRPPWAEVLFRIRPARTTAVTAYCLAVLNAVAAVIAGLADGKEDHLLDRLAILTVPTTIAAAFFLTREQTAVAQRVGAFHRSIVGVTAVALFLVVFVRVSGFHPPPSANCTSTNTVALPHTPAAPTIRKQADAEQQCS